MEKKKRGVWKKIKVFVRVKPLGAGGGGGEDVKEGQEANIDFSETAVVVDKKKYTYPHRVIPPVNGDNVFTRKLVVPELVDAVLNGYDVNLFAFGQTGSGKTHTIFGPPECLSKSLASRNLRNREFGIFPETIICILYEMKEREKSGKIKFILTGQMLELYFMRMHDILNKKRTLCYDSENVLVYVAEERFLESEEDIVKLAAMSESRATRGTLMNETSSRSHCLTPVILTVLDLETNKVRTSCFRMIDLAGSERVKTAHGSNQQQPESIMARFEGVVINLTLFGLVFMLERIAKSKKKNKLNELSAMEKKGKGGQFVGMEFMGGLLKGTFTGTCFTSMIVNISQAPKNTRNSDFAVNFGKNVSMVPMAPKKNKWMDLSLLKKRARRNFEEAKKSYEKLKDRGHAMVKKKFIPKRENRLKTASIELKKLKKLEE